MIFENENIKSTKLGGYVITSTNHYVDELFGSIEEIDLSDVCPSHNPIRNSSDSLTELADSIDKIGLLSPILVRFIESGKFEVVAGNRRFRACKLLGRKKIPCQIVELDDRSAFEASVVENIQRKTLNIIEEAMAFKKYVNEFGWGAASEMADKLSKSPSYVSKRMRLLELPEDVIQLIFESEISVSTGEELLSIKEKSKQSRFAALAVKNTISSTDLRKMIKEEKDEENNSILYHTDKEHEKEKFLKTFDKSIVALRVAMNKLASNIENIEDNWILYEILMNHKNTIHSQIDLLIREKKKYIERNHFFDLNRLDD